MQHIEHNYIKIPHQQLALVSKTLVIYSPTSQKTLIIPLPPLNSPSAMLLSVSVHYLVEVTWRQYEKQGEPLLIKFK